MNKLDFFLKAMNAGEYRRTEWVISAFSIIKENISDWTKNPYPYRIVQTPTGSFFVDPDNKMELTQIDDTVAGTPIFSFKDKISLKAGQVINLDKDVETTYGNLFVNYLIVIYPFGNKIKYLEGKIDTNRVEKLILNLRKDSPDNPEERNDTDIYVDEYLKFTDAVGSLASYSQLCVPGSTEKTMTAPPDIIEFRNKLLEENKNRLHDPAVIAKIDAQLVAHLKEWMKDDEGMGFLISEKSFSNVRRKLFLMGGAETSLEDNPQVDLVVKSLSEGWDPKYFAIMNTASRAGSYSRGAQTELGGEAVKWLFRASSNITVTQEDCGSVMGINIIALPGQEGKLIGFTAINADNQEKITKDNVGMYLGKVVKLRSPMFCKLGKTDYCKTCVGEKLATNPTGLSTAIAEYGSTFLGTFMKAMHDKSLSLAKMNVNQTFI